MTRKTARKKIMRQMKQTWPVFLFFFLAVFATQGGWGIASLGFAEDSFDLSKLTSPILPIFPEEESTSNEKICGRDPAVLWRNGAFYLYFTLIEMENQIPYSYVGMTVSRDLVHFEPVKKLTPKDRSLNFSSPGNVIEFEGKYVLCCQTYCQENGEKYGNARCRLWTMTSNDLRNWSEPVLLRVKGEDVPVEQMGRMIDPYLIEDRDEPGTWWCFYKQNGVSLSSSRDLVHWTFHKSVTCGENVCILYDDEKQEYRLWHSPQNGIGEMTSRNLRDWTPNDRLLTLGQQNWPWAQGRLTAAVIVDLRHEPTIGKALMFFHASKKPESELFPQGTSLGVAWSDDLEHWFWPEK